MKTDNPCYECTKRVVGCHSKCKEHKDYQEKKQQRKSCVMASRKQDRVFDAYLKRPNGGNKMNERERLIEWLVGAETKASKEFYNCNTSRMKAEIVADYLIANGIIVPPCKVGEKVWFV